MSKRAVFASVLMILAMVAVAPLAAQGGAAPATEAKPASMDVVVASIITAGFALGIAGGLGAIGQGRAIGSAAEAIARNPSTVGDIRGLLILGLVFIESLVIYVLFISITLVFIKPWG